MLLSLMTVMSVYSGLSEGSGLETIGNPAHDSADANEDDNQDTGMPEGTNQAFFGNILHVERLQERKNDDETAEDNDDEAAEDKKPFLGIPMYMHSGHNMSRVSHMLYKAIQQHKITSMVDIPCRSHSRWMGQLLQHLPSKHGKPFQYYCVDSSEAILELAQTRLPPLRHVSTEFILRAFWKLPMPKADLVFAWEGLEKMKKGNVLSLFNLLLKGKRHKYLLVGSSPSVKNAVGAVLNVRKSPFSFNLPKRIYKQLAVTRSRQYPEKHMYLYEIADMKKSK